MRRLPCLLGPAAVALFIADNFEWPAWSQNLSLWLTFAFGDTTNGTLCARNIRPVTRQRNLVYCPPTDSVRIVRVEKPPSCNSNDNSKYCTNMYLSEVEVYRGLCPHAVPTPIPASTIGRCGSYGRCKALLACLHPFTCIPYMRP